MYIAQMVNKHILNGPAGSEGALDSVRVFSSALTLPEFTGKWHTLKCSI
jgi:hypothetical protein